MSEPAAWEVVQVETGKTVWVSVKRRDAEIRVETYFQWCEVEIRPLYRKDQL